MTAFKERVQRRELLLILLIHIISIGTFDEETLSLLNVFEKPSLVSKVNKVCVLIILLCRQERL